MSVVIKTVNLTKRYGTLVALSNLNLEISAGDCFGFIGPNGAGKSTTIKILATLLQPTWGDAPAWGGAPRLRLRRRLPVPPDPPPDRLRPRLLRRLRGHGRPGIPRVL